jgi:hypothetical protein
VSLSSRRRRPLLLLVVALVLAVSGGVPRAAAGASAARTEDGFVRVRVALSTRGEHAALRVPAGARVVNARVVRGRGAYWDERGFLVGTPRIGVSRRPNSRSVFEAVLAGLPVDGDTVWQQTCEDGAGTASVFNINDRDAPVRLAGSSCRDLSIPASALLDNGPLPVDPAPGDGLVLAHYVPWYWDGDYSCCYNRPLDASGATNDAGYVGRAIDEARATGLDGFTVTTYGLPHRGLEVYLDEAGKRQGWVTVLQLATRIANPAKTWQGGTQPSVLADWIVGLMDRYAEHPSLLRMPDGRVVFLAYWAPTLTLSQWESVLARVEEAGHRVALVGEQVRPEWLHTFAGDYIFNTFAVEDLDAAIRRRGEVARSWHLLHPDETRRIWMGTASPGMHDSNASTGHRLEPREDGALYLRQWDAMDAGRPDWRMIVSWNDYGEDTTIEASEDWGRTYLDLTAARIDALR